MLFNIIGFLTNAIPQTRNQWCEWLSRNNEALALLTTKWSRVRWDALLQQKAFAQYRNFIDKLYNSDEDFQRVCHDNIKGFIDRVEARKEIQTSRELVWKYSLEYLLEECVVMFLWNKDQVCEYELYPTHRSPAMQYVWESFFNSNELRPVALRFRHLQNYGHPSKWSTAKCRKDLLYIDSYETFL